MATCQQWSNFKVNQILQKLEESVIDQIVNLFFPAID